MRAPRHPGALPPQPEVPISSSSTPRTFTVRSPNAEREVQGRAAAIQAAKTMSRRTWKPVVVQRHDQRVEMRFRRGNLQEFKLETRRKQRA